MSDNKKKSSFEKLILGAVIGAAVGSVIGAAVAPDKGKQTRQKLSQQITDLSKGVQSKIATQQPLVVEQRKTQSLFTRIINKFKKADGKTIPTEQSNREEVS